MVRNLYLLRHGHAEHATNIKDFDRSLTPKGASEVVALGSKLKAAGFLPDIVFCSPSLRTRQTAEILLSAIGSDIYVEFIDEIYEASVKTLFDTVVSADVNHYDVLLIGHNPAISYLNDYLTKENNRDLSPGQISKMTFVDQSWDEISKGTGNSATLDS
ncbi:MAG: phosphohistidine phosphatase [Marinoscillum sp.]|jgi:phosphohistidine phosphatase